MISIKHTLNPPQCDTQLNIPGLQRVTCNDCGAPADFFCARCGIVPYCTAQCQRRDWHNRHKSVCHNLSRLSSAGNGPTKPGVDQPNAGELEEGIPPAPAPLRRPRSPNANRNQQQRDRNNLNNFNRDKKQATSGGEPNNNKTKFASPNHHPQPAAPARAPRSANNNRNNNAQEGGNWGETKTPEPKSQVVKPNTEIPKLMDLKTEIPKTIPIKFEIPKQVDIKTEMPTQHTREKSSSPEKPNVRMGANLTGTTPQPKPTEVALVPAQYLIEKLPIGESFLISVDQPTETCATKQPGFVCLMLHADYQDQYNLLLEDIFDSETPCDVRPGDTIAYLDPSDGGWYRARCLSRTSAALLDSGKVVPLSQTDQCRALAKKYAQIPEFCCVLSGNVELGMSLKCTVLMKAGDGYRVSIDVAGQDTYVGEGEVSRWLPIVEAQPAQIEKAKSSTTPVQQKEDKPQVQPTPPNPRQDKPQIQPSPLQPRQDKPQVQPTPPQPRQDKPQVQPTPPQTRQEPQVAQAPAKAQQIPEVPRPPIVNNDRYFLVHATSLKRACIRPCSAESTAEFEGSLQDVAMYGVQTSKQLSSPPQPGDLVLSQFEGIHYRALVRRTKAKDNRYMVEYVEYGNEEIVPLEKLYTCPPELDLSSRPPQASIIQISTIASPELSPPALEYVDGVKEIAELIAKVPGGTKTIPSGSLVELVIEKNMEAFSKTLEQMCTPEWKKLEERGGDVLQSEVLMFGDMKTHPLPTDREFDMDVTDFNNIVSGVISGFVKGDKLADYIYGPLTEKINEYCNSQLCSEPYLPAVEELCLARLHPYPQWFRAVVAEHRPGSATATVLFTDYGNMEEAIPVADLRKCMPELCKEPALAATADIKHWPQPASNEQIVRAVEFLQISDEGRGTLHVERCERDPDGTYIIEVPDLIAAIKSL